MKQKVYVYVLNKKGNPLMPTTRCGRVRKLLKQGLAVPVNSNPFTIRLKYDTPDIVQDLYLGLDTGRENIGEGVSSNVGDCVFLCNTETYNKLIKKNMSQRAEHRKSRRCHNRQKKQRKAIKNKNTFKNGNKDILRSKKTCLSKEITYPGMNKSITHKVIRGAEAQFNNRKWSKNWLSPSGRQLIQMHLKCLEQSIKLLPITHIVLERVYFDFQKMWNQNIRTWEYSKGPLYGYNSYQDYIYDQQDGKCLICGKNHIDEYHHIVPLSQGGSDTPANIAGLCHDCHQGNDGVHKNQEMTDQLKTLKEGLISKNGISLLSSVMPFLIEEVSEFCKEHNIEFSVTDGKETAKIRKALGLDDSKDHCIDGYCISLTGRKVKISGDMPTIIHKRRRFKKKSNNNIQKLGRREYKVKGKTVAINRHKATEQKWPSLEEYMNEYGKIHSKKECSQHLHELEVSPAKRTYTYHKAGTVCKFHAGDKVKYNRKHIKSKRVDSFIFICESIYVTEKSLHYNRTKKCKIKYCNAIESDCLAFVGTSPLLSTF